MTPRWKKTLLTLPWILALVSAGLTGYTIHLNTLLQAEKDLFETKMIRAGQDLRIALETARQSDPDRSGESGSTDSLDLIKEEQLRRLISEYMSQRDHQRPGNDLLANHSESLRKFRREKRFIPDLMPVNGQYRMTQRYDAKHTGIDLAGEEGTEIVAVAAGVVTVVRKDKYYGNMVIIDHLNNYKTLYAHLKKAFIPERMFIEKGEAIGLLGDTGFSTAPHLHFEILHQGRHIDPATMLIALQQP